MHKTYLFPIIKRRSEAAVARERYLIGVDPEELKAAPPPPPEKPAGWWENLWYHYKWHIITGAFLVLLAVIGIQQLVTRDEPDYNVVLLTADPLTREAVEQLEEQLVSGGEDIDGDGKVEVLIENLALGIAYSNQKIANDNTLYAHFAAGDVLLFAMEPEYYESKILSLSDTYQFFTPLSDGSPYYRWKSKIGDSTKELYVGVRNATGTAGGNDTHDQCLKLVESLMARDTGKE